jgi:hypothetical protein
MIHNSTDKPRQLNGPNNEFEQRRMGRQNVFSFFHLKVGFYFQLYSSLLVEERWNVGGPMLRDISPLKTEHIGCQGQHPFKRETCCRFAFKILAFRALKNSAANAELPYSYPGAIIRHVTHQFL